MKKLALIIVLISLTASPAFAQSATDWLFDDSVLPRVDIVIEPDSLDIILFGDSQSDYEFPATFIFTKGEEVDTVANIGFRLRGNTSRASAKKSFKVSFNTFQQGREYRELDKMNLNGEHNDPSIMRAKLSWDIFEAIDLPAPRSNHVKLYINDEYFGLYINVEHIDNEFVQDRFGSDEGNLYKSLWPADLAYRGDNQNEYKFTSGNRRAYELKTNVEEDDYSDLASLISFIENASSQNFEKQIEDYINVDGVLRWMAVDILTGNWDNYWYNQNNYYLYFNPEDNRFEFIPYDYDNTFGIDWVGQDWGERDVNNWGQDKPLTNRILEVEEYRNRLNFYVDKIIEEVFNEELLFPEIDRLKALTEDAAEEDTYRTLDWEFGISDYHVSFTAAVPSQFNHVKYGLKPYITTRVNSALEQTFDVDINPIIRSFKHSVVQASGRPITNFYAEVIDEETQLPFVYAVIYETDSLLKSLPTPLLNDNGLGIDEISGDGIYSGQYQPLHNANYLVYGILITDDSGTTISESKISEKINFKTSIPSILINEFVADNESGIQDEFDAFEDWIELYNPTNEPINLIGYYLTDDLTDKQKWALPDTTIQSGDFLLLWADNDDEEGILHANFGLNNDGEQLGIYFEDDQNILVVDTLSFGPQSNDISYGRNTDGGEEFVFFDNPTPGTQNGVINSTESDSDKPKDIKLFQNYPNPFNPETTISFQLDKPEELSLEIYTIEGRLVQTLANSRYLSGTHSIRFDASSLSSGMYFYRLKTENQSLTKRLVLIK